MQIEFLGTAGALIIPRPGCECEMCAEAREKGVPYSRSGPSMFVHGPDLLIDTPEESAMQLNRARIMHVPHAIYSHWHPDHVLGRRVWEMNFGWTPPDFVRGVDLAVLPMGITEFNPLTGERHIPAAHPILKAEATFRQTLKMVEQLEAGQVWMTHVEEADRLSYDDLCALEERLRAEGYNIRFAYDTLVVEV